MTVPQLKRGLSQAFHEGSQVWVPIVEVVNSTTADGSRKRVTHWKQAVVQSIVKQATGDPLLEARTQDGAVLQLPATECCLQNERDDTVDDLVKSDFLHEPGILHTLRVRYSLDAIYTYSGNILIAANPHKRLRLLYGNRMMAQYKGVPLGELSPHVYAIAEQAYSAMMMDEQRQAILISGESGAGKTESAKMVMQYLAHRAMPSFSAHASAAAAVQRTLSNGHEAPIEEQVLESNPLLEAFGNAKTSRNDNSSRFGKFVEIDFDATGRVAGASISTYLLERSRVVSIKSPERSYHIFYQLCAGADEEQRLALRLEHGVDSFRYLSQSDVFELYDVDDAEQFRHTLDAMRIVGLSQHSIDSVLRLVACVLHLGNIEFVNNAADEATIADAGSMQALEAAAALLGVTELGLESALTTRAIETRGERIIKRLSAEAASESRDALAKTLYARLFDWLVAAINRKIGSLGTGRRTQRSIGILDIYGFESFDINSFEQLCINLANERLQQQFNAHVFKGEQEEYAREGISWSYIDFVDNQDCLDLLEGTVTAQASQGTIAAGLGVFPLIDEACRLPRATFKDLAHTLRTRLAAHPRFGVPRRLPFAFAVDHYAGEVVYSSDYLMDKNKDFVVAEHAHLMAGSSIDLVRQLFNAEAAALGGGGAAAADALANQSSSELPSPNKLPPGLAQRKSAFMLSSVGARFRKQLQGLMATLSQCQPHYIRCVKPNPESRPGSLTPEYVLEQLRAGGVLEAVRIACAGFPTRKPFLPFAQRYSVLLSKARLRELGVPLTPTGFVDWYSISEAQVVDICKRLLFGSGLEGWQLGRTRVFLRAGQLAQLEGARGQRLSQSAVLIQAAYRGMEARTLLRTARAAAIRIQATWRGRLARKYVTALRRQLAATRVQAAFRMHAARRRFVQHRRSERAVIVQSYVRMWLARKRFLHDTEVGRRAAERAAEESRRIAAAVAIQKHVRRRAAHRKVALLLAEARRLRAIEEERQRLAQERDRLAEERNNLAVELDETRGRAERAEGALEALQAQVSSLEAELQAARVQLAQFKVMATASAASAAEAARLAELEAAQRAAAAAQESELGLLRRQKAEAEERGRHQEAQVSELHSQVASHKEELAAVVAAAAAKDKENERLWQQVKQAADETQREFEKREVAIQQLQAQLAQQARQAEEAQQALRQETQQEVAAVRAELQRQVGEAQALAESRVAAMRDMQDKIQHLNARVAAVTSHSTRVENELRAAGSREQALARDLEAAKRAAFALERSPSLARARTLSTGGTLSPVRTLSTQMEAAAGPDPGGREAATGAAAALAPQQAQALAALLEAAVAHKLHTVHVPVGSAGTLPMPVAAWLLCESFIRWAGLWAPPSLDAAATRLEDSIVAAAARGGLGAQAYWLCASLATGALLKVRTIGLREGGLLLRLGDALIFFGPLHDTLAEAVADMLPVNVALLLSDEAKKSARRKPTPTRGTLGPPSPDGAVSHWKSLLGGMSNVLDILASEGVPPPALRAVSWAMLRYIDAELLNALLLRRDCCSVSAAKALLAGLGELLSWVGYVGAEMAGSPIDAEKAIDRVSQAARYLVQGKEDCMRKSMKGVDITLDLARLCPALSLQQIYKLTEHQHDDWIAGTAVGTNNIVLLETLRRLMDEQQARAGGVDGVAPLDGPSPPSEEGDDSLLVDSREAFVLPRKLLNDAARCFVQAPAHRPSPTASPSAPALLAGPQAGGAGSAAAAAAGGGLRRAVSSKAPRLPDGSLPHIPSAPGLAGAAAGAPPPAGLALLDTIGHACRGAELPEGLASNPEFSFLRV